MTGSKKTALAFPGREGHADVMRWRCPPGGERFSRATTRCIMRGVRVVSLFPLLLVACAHRASSVSPAPVAALDCPRDLEFAASFLLANDGGIRAHGWAAYPDHVARGLAEQRAAAPAASTPERCAQVIQRFFRHVRK